MHWAGLLFAGGGLAFAFGMVEANDHSREQYQHELAVIRSNGDQVLKPSMASLCSNYFEWSLKYERVEKMEQVCGDYLAK